MLSETRRHRRGLSELRLLCLLESPLMKASTTQRERRDGEKGWLLRREWRERERKRIDNIEV